MDEDPRTAEYSGNSWHWPDASMTRRAALRRLNGLGLSVAGGVAALSASPHVYSQPGGAPEEGAAGAGGWELAPETTTSLSYFDVVPVYAFRGSYLGPNTYTANTYNPDGHYYYDDYVRPTLWHLGLMADRSLYASMTNQPLPIARHREPFRDPPVTIDEWLEQELAPDIDVDPPRSPALPPANLVEYEFSVVAEAGDYDESIVNPRNHATPWLAQFQLPHEGRYKLSCTVRFTDRPDEITSTDYFLRDFLIASIGDSFASGQGNPDVAGDAQFFTLQCDLATISQWIGADIAMETEPIWLEPLAARSMRSGHARAAWSLQRMHDLSDGTQVDDRITFISHARTGATINDGLFRRQDPDADFVGVGQIVELMGTAGARPVDALLVSIGGNDIGFADALRKYVEGDFETVWSSTDDAAAREEVMERTRESLAEGGEVDTAFKDLAESLAALQRIDSVRDIYITTYPTSLFDVPEEENTSANECSDGRRFLSCGVFCGPDLDVTPADNDDIVELGTMLNDRIRKQAKDAGWIMVDVDKEGTFAGRGYCASNTYWVGATRSCDWQGNFDGIMHPNDSGHGAVAFLLSARIQEMTINKRALPGADDDAVGDIETPVVKP